MQPELLDDYVRVVGPSLRSALTATAVRYRSLDARLLMAWAALGRSGTLDELLTAARAGDRRWLARIRRQADPVLLAGLAQIVALQDMLPSDRSDALALYELIRKAYGPNALSAANQALHAQLTMAWEGPARVPRLLRVYWRMTEPAVAALEVDLRNPFVGARPVGPWLAAFQTLLPAPPPILDPDVGLAPFDRLTSPAAGRIEAPQRVSVVVTAYRPDRGLITAVKSILAQTWRNVEVIIVDDGSPPEFDEILAEAVALGERIRVVKQAENRGTYAARNVGLDACGGEFVTFQDSDDWSHPRRLELQVAPLLADNRLVATTSDGMAVTEDLLLNRPGVRRGRFNPSSLLLRRTLVLGRVGYFDPVRKAADSEFIDRMRAAFGTHLVRHLEQGPLALIRLSENSLSRAEIRVHWMHPARIAYSSAYFPWHQAIAAGQASPFRPADGSGRPYAVPSHLLVGTTPRGVHDVVLAGDWRFRNGSVRAAVDEIQALVAAGLRVAVVQLGSYRAMFRPRFAMCEPIQQLVNRGLIDHVQLGDPGETKLLIVRQAAVLQFASDEPSALRPARVLVVADQAPARGDGADRRYDTTTCTRRARHLFGVEPRWCPQDAGVRAELGEVLLTREDLPAIVDSAGWSATREAATAGRPIVGTDLADAGVWPGDLRDVLKVIRGIAEVEVDVRLRLPDRPLPGIGPEVPESWLAYAAADIGPRPFAHQLDFYLHFPHPRAAEALSRPALEAAAVGCVVVLPERSAAVYGDAAVYTTPDGVPEVIRRYRDDPGMFAEQSRRARAVVAKAHHPQLFADRVTGLLRPPALPAPRNGVRTSGVTDVWPPDDLARHPAETQHP